jgi:hypothetical protein
VTDSLPKKGDRLFLKNFIFFPFVCRFQNMFDAIKMAQLKKKKNLRDAT